MKSTEVLMKYINKCIRTNSFNFEEFNDVLTSQNLAAIDRLYILSLIEDNGKNLTKINRELYNYFSNQKLEKKHAKFMEKFKRNKEAQIDLEEAYKQFENYVYSIISMKNYKSKMGKTNEKVKLYTIENLFGHDGEQTLKDVLQEGRTILWEGIKKFGVLPDKSKNFEGRLDKGYKRNIASKSTFVHKNLYNSLTNLSFQASSKKFTHVPIEYNAETLGEKEYDD